MDNVDSQPQPSKKEANQDSSQPVRKQPIVETTPQQPVELPSLPKKRKWLLPTVLIVLVVVLGISGYLVYQNSQFRQQDFQTKPAGDIKTTTPTPKTESVELPVETGTCAYKTINDEDFNDINTYQFEEECTRQYEGWKTATDTGPFLFRLRHPEYFEQVLHYGADSFEIDHPNFGNFSLSTFMHDYYGDTNSLSEKLCSAAQIGHIPNNVSSFSNYKSSEGQYYFFGRNRIGIIVIIAEDGNPNGWGFSLSSLVGGEEARSRESDFMDTLDFKCFIRSIQLLDD